MAKINLLQGSNLARSNIVGAQRQVNLYGEKNLLNSTMPQQNLQIPFKTFYQMPGSKVVLTVPPGPIRGIYKTSQGSVYAVSGGFVIQIMPDFSWIMIGMITPQVTPVRMLDNGIQLVIVDGTPTGGWYVTLATNAFNSITDASWQGSTHVGYLDSFFIFNAPGNNTWYSSLSNGIDFDPEYVSTKAGFPDSVGGLATINRLLWLLGSNYSSEIWYDAGASDFPFQVVEGVYVEQAIVAPYSLASHDQTLFWLSQNKDGGAIFMAGNQYSAIPVSNRGVEWQLEQYGVLSDARGWTFQMNGHPFYVCSFPTADKTWVYNINEEEWLEWTWLDANGLEHRVRHDNHVYFNNKHITGDFENGNFYQLDNHTFTDFGGPIIRRKTFPHISTGKRSAHARLMADVEVGQGTGNIYLRYSDDRGNTWSEPLAQSLGEEGQFLTQPLWNQLGYARDRLYELFWSGNGSMALSGVWVEISEMVR